MEDENIDYVKVSIILKGSDNVVNFDVSDLGFDEHFLNMVPIGEDKEDLISINRDQIVVLSSKKVYKEDE